MDLRDRLLAGLAAVALGVAVSAASVAQVQQRPQQGGANSQERLSTQNAQAALAAAPPSGFQTCASDEIVLHNGVQTSTETVTTVALPVASAVVLTFSSEILAPTGGTVNLDYIIDGASPVPVGPEFFANDNNSFATRTAVGVTLFPFVGPLPAGVTR